MLLCLFYASILNSGEITLQRKHLSPGALCFIRPGLFGPSTARGVHPGKMSRPAKIDVRRNSYDLSIRRGTRVRARQSFHQLVQGVRPILFRQQDQDAFYSHRGPIHCLNLGERLFLWPPIRVG
jgi:hypothetical protein